MRVNQPEIRQQTTSLDELATRVGRSDGQEAADFFSDQYSPDAYPVVTGPFDALSDVRSYAETRERLDEDDRVVRVMGRVATIRSHSNFAFLVLGDANNDHIQVMVPRKERDPDSGDKTPINTEFLSSCKPGNFVLATGMPVMTRTGEPTVSAHEVINAAPSYMNVGDVLPRIIDNQEEGAGEEALDARQERIRAFTIRSKTKSSIRNSLEEDDFTEVITPVLMPEASGANADVFQTQVNALNTYASLRISPELSLKAAIVEGYGTNVYEFATDFRNEGIDREHSPEFEMLEFYRSFTSSDQLRDITEKMIADAAQKALGTTVVELEKEHGKKITIDLGEGKWQRASYRDLILDSTGLDLDLLLDLSDEEMKRTLLNYLSETYGEELSKQHANLGPASLIDKVFKYACRPSIDQPTFVERYPAIMIPLARPSDDDNRYVDMFQGIVGSMEILKGYQELNDPVKQLENLTKQAAAKSGGDTEAMNINWPYIETMLKGMPPIAGCGIGIDRLAALLCGTKNVHTAITWPMRERFAK